MAFLHFFSTGFLMSRNESLFASVKLRLRKRAGIQGCNEKEIEQLEARLGISFPHPYREFLAIGGKSGVCFWGDVTSGHRELESINLSFWRDVRFLSAERGFAEIPRTAFAICTLRTEQYRFILLDKNLDACPVFNLNVDTSRWEKRFGFFWEMVDLILTEKQC